MSTSTSTTLFASRPVIREVLIFLSAQKAKDHPDTSLLDVQTVCHFWKDQVEVLTTNEPQLYRFIHVPPMLQFLRKIDRMIDQFSQIVNVDMRTPCDKFMMPAVMEWLSKNQHNDFSIAASDQVNKLQLIVTDTPEMIVFTALESAYKSNSVLEVEIIHKDETKKRFYFYPFGFVTVKMQGSNFRQKFFSLDGEFITNITFIELMA